MRPELETLLEQLAPRPFRLLTNGWGSYMCRLYRGEPFRPPLEFRTRRYTRIVRAQRVNVKATRSGNLETLASQPVQVAS